jgi:hypothetical protein
MTTIRKAGNITRVTGTKTGMHMGVTRHEETMTTKGMVVIEIGTRK